MPAYITQPQQSQVVAMYPGSLPLTLFNQAVDGNSITNTIQFAVGPNPAGPNRITFLNTSGQTATVQVAQADGPNVASANYQPYTDAENNAVTIGTGKAVTVDCDGPWVRCNFSSSPSAGVLVVSR